MTIAPFTRAVHIKAPPAKAFEIFTAQIGRWWPKGGGLGAKPLVEVVIEPGAGGRWFERDADGAETQWGRVLVWQPPERLILAWQLNREKRFDPNLVTEVELTFTAAKNGGTDVTLEHRDLERFGPEGAQWVSSIGGGWSQKLGEFAAFADLPDQED
jgi:uncharacterized protein YndB with AHSA1/START domain